MTVSATLSPSAAGDIHTLRAGVVDRAWTRSEKRSIITCALGNSVRQPSRRRYITIDERDQSPTSILTGQMSEDDCRHVRVLDPGVDKSNSGIMDEDHGVGALACYVENEVITLFVREACTVPAFARELVQEDEASVTFGFHERVRGFKIPEELGSVDNGAAVESIKGLGASQQTFRVSSDLHYTHGADIRGRVASAASSSHQCSASVVRRIGALHVSIYEGLTKERPVLVGEINRGST